MKKKLLLVCFQNYYVLEDYKYDLEKLTNEFDISVCVSNFKLNNQKKKELEYFCKQNKIQKLMVIPYYSSSKGGERSLISIIFTHLYLILLRVKINFKNFQYCLSDNKLFIWQKIILENHPYDIPQIIGINVDKGSKSYLDWIASNMENQK